MCSSCSGLCRTKSLEASALVLKHEEVEWIGTDILYSSDILTLLFLLLLSSRSQKRDVDKNAEGANSASDNDVLSVKEDDDESKDCELGTRCLKKNTALRSTRWFGKLSFPK